MVKNQYQYQATFVGFFGPHYGGNQTRCRSRTQSMKGMHTLCI